jgi:hypothetical protein
MHSKIVAFKIARRSASVAVFSGRHLDFLETKHLSNVPDKAGDALRRFVGWVFENFHPQLAALGLDEEDRKPRAALLASGVEKQLLQHGIPVWKVMDSQLLEAYSVPALTRKQELREIGRSMWPQVTPERNQFVVDAALIGLYVQVERLLSKN